MMTVRSQAESIEFSRLVPQARSLSALPREPGTTRPGREGEDIDGPSNEFGLANELKQDDLRSVSLALDDDQQLDPGAWEQRLVASPALAKHCKVQGLLRSQLHARASAGRQADQSPARKGEPRAHGSGHSFWRFRIEPGSE